MAHGVDYSCYKYAYATTHEAARIEADTVINLLKDRRMMIWYDMEDKSLVPLGLDGIEGIALSFIGECKEAGYDVGIYCNKNWYDNYISKYLKRKFKFWFARYGKNTGFLDEKYKPSGANILAWQYTSKGQVPGITGYVDMDVLL
jgi:GH25 family lysozyme M1 (1,4-beta-N-acetylmuramidase)